MRNNIEVERSFKGKRQMLQLSEQMFAEHERVFLKRHNKGFYGSCWTQATEIYTMKSSGA